MSSLVRMTSHDLGKCSSVRAGGTPTPCPVITSASHTPSRSGMQMVENSTSISTSRIGLLASSCPRRLCSNRPQPSPSQGERCGRSVARIVSFTQHSMPSPPEGGIAGSRASLTSSFWRRSSMPSRVSCSRGRSGGASAHWSRRPSATRTAKRCSASPKRGFPVDRERRATSWVWVSSTTHTWDHRAGSEQKSWCICDTCPAGVIDCSTPTATCEWIMAKAREGYGIAFDISAAD